MKLTIEQQKKLLHSLPVAHKVALKTHIKGMGGSGIGDIINSVKKFLEPVMPAIKEFGPKILKEFVLPFIKKKMEGGALNLPGSGLSPAGMGLKLAGQGKKLPHQVKGSQAAKDHMAKLRAMRKK